MLYIFSQLNPKKGIIELLGYALGCVGMSYDDFCRCTPEEFKATTEAWNEMREAEERISWERMRLLATITIQPHVRSRLTATKLLPFPWDNPKQQCEKWQKVPKPLSAEGSKAKFEKLIERINGGCSEDKYHCQENHPG